MAWNLKSREIPTYADIESAYARISKFIHRTPVLTSTQINKITGVEIFFKCENFQKVGAFKARGALAAITSLLDEILQRGVATHSSGNHAQAIAYGASLFNVPATIVMPRTAPRPKVEAVRAYGADIIFCEPTEKSRKATLQKFVERSGAIFIHPYDNFYVIAGQGTCAKEFLESFEYPNFLDYLIAPIGGGGLMSGTLVATKHLSPKTQVIGAEPKGADDAFRSIRDDTIYPSINPQTIADGLLTSLSEKTFNIIKNNISKILTVEEETIINSMKLIWERMKIVVEPSAAVPLAAIIENPTIFKGTKVGLIITGGNLDLDKIPWVR
jgi:threonine dehydratase